jgi:hypothetical protein
MVRSHLRPFTAACLSETAWLSGSGGPVMPETRSEEDYPAAFVCWLAESTGAPVPRFEKAERGEASGRRRDRGDDLLAAADEQ